MSAGPLVVLASASPRRRELLTQAGVPHRVCPVDIDETRGAGETPRAFVRRMAHEKAEAGREVAGGLPAIGADTEVILGDRVFGKPTDAKAARAMLRALSGRTHEVVTSVALARPDGETTHATSVSRVTFAPLPAGWIERYCAGDEPLDKAGAYAVQGRAAVWICRLEGSYSGVMGLPLYETAELLRDAGLAW